MSKYVTYDLQIGSHYRCASAKKKKSLSGCFEKKKKKKKRNPRADENFVDTENSLTKPFFSRVRIYDPILLPGEFET